MRIDCNRYVNRAIATNMDELDDSEIVHWYNRRGEHSEKSIRELKQEFAAGRLPCTNHQASALWFALSAFAFNMFVLFRQLLTEELEGVQATTVRHQLLPVT